jgi:predicted XRE-type DNA-binding protein
MTTKTTAKRDTRSHKGRVARGARGGAPDRRPATTLAGSAHVTRPGGNVFADLGFPADEAENLKMRARLMSELREVIAHMTQVEAAELLGVSQPRVSDLTRGKIGLFTIDALVNMLAHAGVRLRVSLTRPPSTAA